MHILMIYYISLSSAFATWKYCQLSSANMAAADVFKTRFIVCGNTGICLMSQLTNGTDLQVAYLLRKDSAH